MGAKKISCSSSGQRSVGSGLRKISWQIGLSAAAVASLSPRAGTVAAQCAHSRVYSVMTMLSRRSLRLMSLTPVEFRSGKPRYSMQVMTGLSDANVSLVCSSRNTRLGIRFSLVQSSCPGRCSCRIRRVICWSLSLISRDECSHIIKRKRAWGARALPATCTMVSSSAGAGN